MLDYVEWTISQADLDTGILSLGRAYSERYPATLATLAEQIGPIGYFNVSTMALGIIEGTANLAQALAIANGTEGVDVITCTDFSELFRELCRHYLEQDDPDHPVCTCYLPGGTLYLRKKEKGISLVVGGFIWPVSLMRDATDQERNAMLLNVLTNFNFQQDGENQWRAVLAPAMTRHFVEKAFSQLPFDTRASSQFAIVLSPAGHYTPA